MEEEPLSGKIKSLILLSLVHEKIHKNKNISLEIAFIINKDYLNSFYFTEINEMIIKNEKIQEKIKELDINKISENDIDKFIEDLDYDLLKKYDNDISQNQKDFSYEIEKEDIKLYESEKTIIYKDFFIIYKNFCIQEYFRKYFGIEFTDLDIFFGTYNGRDIILDSPNFAIYLLILNEEKMAYNIEYILVPKEKNQTFFNQLYNVVTCGFKDYNDYFNIHFLFNNDIENKDYISSIFVGDEIIGNCYKYNSDIKDYTKLNDYTKYLQFETLTNILSLYSFNIQIQKKTTSMIIYKKYYIVNSKFLNEIKMASNFNEIYNCLEKNIYNIYFDEKTNEKNLYFMIKNLPIGLLEEYTDKKLNHEFNADDIEPLQTEINYNEKESLTYYSFDKLVLTNSNNNFIDKNDNQNKNNQNYIMINNNENNNNQNIILNNINDESQYSENPYIYFYFDSCPNIGLEILEDHAI